jgi:hypothetical protein
VQDTGLAFYYQRKWGEAFQHYVRACRVIIAKFGNNHVDLGAPIFNGILLFKNQTFDRDNAITARSRGTRHPI